MSDEGLTIAHALPGRLRVKLGAMKRNPELAAEIQKRLSALPGAYDVQANPLTASVLVKYYDDEVPPLVFADKLAAALEEYAPGLDRPSFTRDAQAPLETTEITLAEGLPVFFRRLDGDVREATGGTGLNTIVPGSLFAWGALSLLFARKVILPPWYELLWFALGTFFLLNPERALEGDRPGSGTDEE